MRRRIRRLIESFSAAGCGVRLCLQNERNFRIHLVSALYVLVLALMGGLNAPEFALVFICFALVIGAEMFNTAIELMCDRQGGRFDTVTKAIKDISAGAVLVCAVFACGVGLVLFARPPVLHGITRILRTYPAGLAAFVLSVPAALIFIKGRNA